MASKSHTYFLFALLSICSTSSLSKLFHSHLKKPCGLPSSQHALRRKGQIGLLAQQPWESSLICGMAQKAMWDWELGQSPILGFPFQFFLPPERLSGLDLSSCNCIFVLVQPRKGFCSLISAVAYQIHSFLEREGGLSGERMLKSQEKDFP